MRTVDRAGKCADHIRLTGRSAVPATAASLLNADYELAMMMMLG